MLDRDKIGIDNLGLERRGFKLLSMAKNEMLPGTLGMLILRVLQPGPIHGYAIAQRIHTLSKELLQVEEGSLYPALQKMLLKGWVKAEWGISETNRKVRFYKLTAEGRRQLQSEIEDFDRVLQGIRSVMSRA
jgi:PadR family transcriptional regulator PadR